jgi:site-specific DNA recombinase
MIVAIYARVSSEDQAAPERYGIKAQVAACEAYAKQHGMVIAGKYTEQISGAEMSRPEFEKLLNNSEKFQAVIMYDQSRLARDIEVSYAYLKTLTNRGLEVHTTQRGKLERGLIFGIDALMSEEERERIRKRTIAGRVQRAREGKLPIGLATYGYRYDKNTGTVSIHKEEAKAVKYIFREAKKRSIESIRKDLEANPDMPAPMRGGRGNRWWNTTITKMIQTPTYKGEYTYKPKGLEPIVIQVPAIVTPEQWKAAQHQPRQRHAKTSNALVGYLRCGVCGHAMTSRRVGRDRAYQYRCISNGGVYELCGNGAIMCRLLEPQVEKELRRIINSPRAFEKAQAAMALPEADDQALKAIEAQRERLTDAYVNLGVLTKGEYQERMRELEEKRKGIQQPRKSSVSLAELREAVEGATLVEMLEAFNVTVTWSRKVKGGNEKIEKLEITVNPF